MDLKRFRKITLAPGQKRSLNFTLTPKDLELLDRNLEPVVEPGAFEVMVGSSSADLPLKGSFEVRP